MAAEFAEERAGPRDVLVVANPTAGGPRRRGEIDRLLECLDHRGLRPHAVDDLDRLPGIARELQAFGQLRAVVAGGGDGTVAEVVNRLPGETPITVYPLGTANLLAKYLGITRDPARFADMLAAAAAAQVDAGCANGRVFVLLAGCGFDADVVERLHQLRAGGHSSYWKWVRPMWHAARRYRYPKLRVYCQLADGRQEMLPDAYWAFVVNLPPYAGGISLAPHAVGVDGLLDVSTFGGGSLWHGLRYLSYVWLARHHALADFKSVPVKGVRIESDERVPYQLDGDPGGHLPLEVSVLPARLTLVARRERLLALGLPLVGAGAGSTS